MTLDELRVRDLGVIGDLTLVLGPGMTALTGETGAGKTLVVEAIELLLGGKADPLLVRPGAEESRVEGRFRHSDGSDVILSRVVAGLGGRSRAYVDGEMASAAVLAERGAALADLHGQHAHQSLLSPLTQRAALDAAAGVDHGPADGARRRLREITARLAGLGGDERARARELDLLRYQLDDLDRAQLRDPGEDEALAGEEARLSGAVADRAAAEAAWQALAGDETGGSVLDALGAALGALGGREVFGDLQRRLSGLGAEADDIARDLRALGERIEEDPERLEAIRLRRQLLRDLRRRYGETLAEVMAEAERIRERVGELSAHEERAGALEHEQRAASSELEAAEAETGRVRRAFAPRLAASIEGRLQQLAMPRARFEITVEGGPAGDEVTWRLGANPGEPALPLARVASGGELARTMLAARLELSLGEGGAFDGNPGGGTGSRRPAARGPSAPPLAGAADAASTPGAPQAASAPGAPQAARTLIFDEVDAGIGGEAALAVGRALSDLSRHHQVIVVTHLAQVAAFADHQVAVTKSDEKGRTIARAVPLGPGERVVELSRMLSGQPDSQVARRHAEELLAAAGQVPSRNGARSRAGDTNPARAKVVNRRRPTVR